VLVSCVLWFHHDGQSLWFRYGQVAIRIAVLGLGFGMGLGMDIHCICAVFHDVLHSI
jgi:hypothetical protein